MGKDHFHKPSFAVWRKMSKASYRDRSQRFADMCNNLHPIPSDAKVAADIGCGPWGGFFYATKFPTMYGVDPVWKSYYHYNLVNVPEDVKVVDGYAQDFVLPELCDVMFSINAINHGGNIKNSLVNMMNYVKEGGLFYFHIHLRTKHMLDRAHPMPIEQSQLDKVLGRYKIIKREILSHDPTRNRPKGRQTYVAVVTK